MCFICVTHCTIHYMTLICDVMYIFIIVNQCDTWTVHIVFVIVPTTPLCVSFIFKIFNLHFSMRQTCCIPATI